MPNGTFSQLQICGFWLSSLISYNLWVKGIIDLSQNMSWIFKWVQRSGLASLKMGSSSLILMAVIACFSICNLVLYGLATESPKYEVVHLESDYEIRVYGEVPWISALVHGTSFDKSTREGFHRFTQLTVWKVFLFFFILITIFYFSQDLSIHPWSKPQLFTISNDLSCLNERHKIIIWNCILRKTVPVQGEPTTAKSWTELAAGKMECSVHGSEKVFWVRRGW